MQVIILSDLQPYKEKEELGMLLLHCFPAAGNSRKPFLSAVILSSTIMKS